ncbi:hypothetical protein BJV78DRAFT_1285972 [Lactifluus subvellereus]|nr:hypothetical protein BJV78DRAFT_1285972 [Lactifluus subvellereus]
MSRLERSGNPNDAQDVATLRQQLLDLLDKEHPDRIRYREVLLLCPPDHESKDTPENLAFSLTVASNFGRMDCLEEAISLYRAALRLCPRVTHVDKNLCVDSPTPCICAAFGHID